MNLNNWLSFPQSPTHSSLQNHLCTSRSHHPSLGSINDHNNDHPFQIQGWNSIGSHAGGEVPKVEDFLGVGKSDNSPDYPAFNHIPATHSDYLFANCTLQSAENSGIASAEDYSYHANSTNSQTLALTMGSGECLNGESSSVNAIEVAPRKTVDTFGQRTSIYRGVTKHRWTGRYEAHLWDNSCRREGQSRKGRQVYLGGYDKEEKAARAYDLAALKYWGTSTTTNFPISSYEREVEEMKHMTRQEYVASLRRKSSGFSRGASMYRGVTRHHQHGRWQARIGRVAGNKDLYLGTFGTEEEAAEAYDIAAIKFRGLNAVTNFEMNRYDVHSIIESNTLPIGGGASKRLKEPEQVESIKRDDEIKLFNNSSYLESFIGFHGYPSMAMQIDPPQPLATQNPHASQFHQNYLHPSLLSLDPQFHQSYFHGHPAAYAHNLVAMGGALSVDSNASSSSAYNGGFVVDGFAMAPNSSAENFGGLGPKPGCLESEYASGGLGVVKADYDMNLGGYGNWSGADSVRGPNHGGFNMWNDT